MTLRLSKLKNLGKMAIFFKRLTTQRFFQTGYYIVYILIVLVKIFTKIPHMTMFGPNPDILQHFENREKWTFFKKISLVHKLETWSRNIFWSSVYDRSSIGKQLCSISASSRDTTVHEVQKTQTFFEIFGSKKIFLAPISAVLSSNELIPKPFRGIDV